MERRDFLHLAATGVVGAGLIPLPAAHGAAGPLAASTRLAAAELAATDLLATLGGPGRVFAVGASYRAQVPSEDDPAVLVELLRDAAARAGASGSGVPLHRRLRAAVSGDFEGSRTVLVDGWVLAVTEARQCALFSHLYA